MTLFASRSSLLIENISMHLCFWYKTSSPWTHALQPTHHLTHPRALLVLALSLSLALRLRLRLTLALWRLRLLQPLLIQRRLHLHDRARLFSRHSASCRWHAGVGKALGCELRHEVWREAVP